MNDNIAIKVENVSKEFRLPHEKTTSIKSAVVGFYKHKRSFEKQQTLSNISFEIKKGEFFGIVGRNGSGKSTLLKLLAGIYTPSNGEIHLKGKLTPFIELGVGFNPELTGRENVFLNGALLGFDRKEMETMYNDIVSFAELKKFMDQKLKNYSSGMQVRLAFSIAIRAKSDILLIDEVLAVGDSAFQRKCYEVFTQLRREGRTIVFVTHDMSAVERFCDKALVIKDGNMIGIYKPSEATVIYDQLNASSNESDDSKNNNDESNKRWGSGEVKVKKVVFYADGKELKVPQIEMGKKLSLKVELTNRKQDSLIVGLAFEDTFGVNIAGPNSKGHKIDGNEATYSISKLPLLPGEYKVTVAVFDEDGIKEYDHLDKYYTLSVTASQHDLYGKINLFGDWSSK